MDATAWATFWAFMGLVVFLGLLVYLKIPAKITEVLDKRAATIRSQLEDARRLREEAHALLAEYQRRRHEAEKEAEDIIGLARREAEAIAADAREKIQEYVARRTRAVEQRIAQAEAQAIAEVRSRAVDVASAAAAQILAEKAQGDAGRKLVDESISIVRNNLN
jgi:F-type H+-transporting ATPase subunit b